MKREIILEICMDLNRGRISAEGAADLIMLQNTSSSSEDKQCIHPLLRRERVDKNTLICNQCGAKL